MPLIRGRPYYACYRRRSFFDATALPRLGNRGDRSLFVRTTLLSALHVSLEALPETVTVSLESFVQKGTAYRTLCL
jgi:hypothetical protein